MFVIDGLYSFSFFSFSFSFSFSFLDQDQFRTFAPFVPKRTESWMRVTFDPVGKEMVVRILGETCSQELLVRIFQESSSVRVRPPLMLSSIIILEQSGGSSRLLP